MKEYEVIREIINQCPLNHSRDQFLRKSSVKIQSYIRERCRGQEGTYEKAFRKMAV